MPRKVSPELLDCLRRANPYTEYRAEISEPDAVRIIRRPDEYLGTPPLVGAMVPANSLSADAQGSLILTPTTAALAGFAGEQSSYDLNGEDPTRRIKGAAWTMDPAFSAAKLRNVTARVQRVALAGLFFPLDFELQVFRVTKTPGNKEKYSPTNQQVQVTAFTDYSFTPLLNPAPVIKSAAIVWDGTQKSTLNFDLTNYALVLENTPSRAAAPDQAGELPRYYFVVRVINNPAGTGFFKWLLDTASARTIANIGTFQRSWWARNNDQEQWVETLFSDVPTFAVNVETYPASGQATYLIDLGKVPDTARGSIGRVAFERAMPPGTAANAELSAGGSAGPWSPVKHGTPVTGRVNLALKSALPNIAPWSAPASAVMNQVGLNGAANTAATITDADAASFVADSQSVAIPADTLPTAVAFWIRRDATINRFPQLRLNLSGGTIGTRSVSLNTATGEWVDANTSGTGLNGSTTVELEEWGGFQWWKVTIVIPGNLNTAATASIYPAARNALTSGELVTVTGSVIYGGMNIEHGVTNIPAPIFTDAAAGTMGAQQTYHLRVTLNPDASTHRTPTIAALGVEWRIPLDVSVEGTPTLPTREVALPWPKASIPEGRIDVVRTGVRDYLDTASVLGSTQATTKLECDIYLASRHPSVTRDRWLHMERLAVSNRVPGSTGEGFTLLSYASKLKKKIPQKVESLNSVHKVTSSTTGAVVVNPALPGTSAGGNEYDGKGYYMRVRTTSNVNVAVGFMQTIVGNTGTTQLDFTPAMPSALSVNDVIEVHSGIFATQAISWNDADPADVWNDILTYAGIPPERIGAGYLPRGGKPPRVTDIAPGDATTQAKRKITNKLTDLESADELLAQVSAILGGVTMEISGQICYVQLFPLRDATGNISVPLSPVVKVFDKRDYGTSLQTPPGLEKRATVMSATYGVPLTAAAPDTYPKQTTVTVDNDALLWLTQQDLEDFGSAQVPDNIARWIYNSADAGLYLAASITATYVRALSTGLRVFPFNAVEKNPELVPGDSIVILTDQYTDYEPSSATPLRGMLAVRGVLVQVGAEGRQLAVFVPGLRDNVTQAQGGNAGTLTGLGDPVDAPILSGSFLATGELIITSYGSYNTASQRVAVGTVEPTDAFTRAGSPILSQNLISIATGLIVPAGGSAWIKAFGYDNYGTESAVARMKVTREGSGTADSPTVFIQPLNGDLSDAAWNVRFSAVPGSGGGGTNLTYDIRRKIGFAAETSIASGNATTLPLDLNLTRHPRSDAVIRMLLTDIATGLTAQDSFTLPSARPELTDTGDQFTSGVKETGGRLVSRLYAKGLVADPDTADAIGNGLTKRAIPFSVLRASDDYLMSGADDNASLAGISAIHATRQIGRYFNETWEALPANWAVNNINGAPTLSLVTGVANVGNNVLQSAGPEDWRTFPRFLPFNPTKLYRIRWRTRATVNVSSGGNFAYCGVECYNSAGTYLGNVYVGGSYPATVAAGWFEFTGWYKGATGFTAHNSADPTAPVSLYAGTSQVRPVYIFRDGSGVGGTNQLDYIQIDELDEDLASRGYTTIDNVAPGRLKSGATESGAKPLNRLFAKTLPADPDNADSVAIGSISRVLPFTVIRTSDNALMSRVNEATPIGSRLAQDVAAGTGTSVFTEVFDTLAGWVSYNPALVALDIASPNSTRGNNVLRVTGYNVFQWNSHIPFDPNKLYRFRVRYQKLVGESGGNHAAIYLGILCFKADGSAANSNSGANYIVVAGDVFDSAIGSFTTTTWVKGATLAFGSAGAPATDATAPAAVNVGAVSMAPYMLINYPTAGSPVGVGMVDFFEITEFDEDAADRTYTVIDVGQKLKTAAKESGGAAVNRLLAKTLAGDPNTFDSVGDGTTYKRIVSVNGSGQITPPSSTPRNRCRCTLSSATQSIPNATNQAVAWDAETYDIGPLHDTLTNNSQIQIPTGGNTGAWLIVGQIQWDANTTGAREIYILKDSTTIIAMSVAQATLEATTGIGTVQTVSALDNAPTVSGIYELICRQDTGSARNIQQANSFFSATHLW